MENIKKENPKTYLREDLFNASVEFCKAYGGGLKVGSQLEFSKDMRNSRAQDYWIGYNLNDSKGNECGIISAGYTGFSPEINLYAEIAIDDEIIDSETQFLTNIRFHDRDKNVQPNELKSIFMKVTDRSTRKLNKLRGIE